MNKLAIFAAVFLAGAPSLGSKDKDKVSFHQMALQMRDAFSCGVVVEQYLHGSLKGNQEAYRKQRDTYHCDYVEQVLNTLHDQDSASQNQ